MNNLVSPSIASGNHTWQTTISKSKSFNGIGLHSGNLIKVNLKPGKENTGIIFVRSDIDKKIRERSIQALYSNVSDNMSQLKRVYISWRSDLKKIGLLFPEKKRPFQEIMALTR